MHNNKGAGSLLATLWLAWSNRQPTIRGVLIGTLALGVLEALFAVSRLYALSLALIASVGGAEMAFATLALTMLQGAAPDHLRGRVMSVATLFFDGSLPLGYLLLGWLAGRYGAPGALLIGAALSAAKNADDPIMLAALERVARTVPPGGTALDLGCGAGVPVTQWLAQRFVVTGVDISARQLHLAREHVPAATLIRASMTYVRADDARGL